jgi:cation diffusion facilitator family transporter
MSTLHPIFYTASQRAERNSWIVMWITALMMVLEITAGWWFNSMALLADGWHMSSHAVAIGLSAVGYSAARRYAHDARFAFGTWKIEVLTGFASAIFLVGVALMMLLGSLERFWDPKPIHYSEAMAVGALGLVVNMLCAFILGHAHEEDDGPQSHGDHGHEDLNLKSAYMHVMADLATSVLAILALLGGWLGGWTWLDPLMGVVGAVMIVVWAKGLMLETGKVLLDREMDHPVVDEIRAAVASVPAQGAVGIRDLHVWRVGKNAYACAMALDTQDSSLTAERMRQHLAQHEEIIHTTIELHYHQAGMIEESRTPEGGYSASE